MPISILGHLIPAGTSFKPYLEMKVKRLVDLPELVAAGLVRSVRGKRGGILLARPPEEITLLQISEAVEARQWLGRCLLGLVTCSDERACPVHNFWKDARQQIESTLRSTTLADVIAHERRMARSRAAR